ncbi:MAG: winged helix-turn-helix transcriptional regulator [Candidatus Hodarchaeales archaeon]
MFDPGDTAEQIYQIIENHPGIHLRGIVAASGRQIGVVVYHLKVLEQAGRIVSIRYRRNKLFFDGSWRMQIDEVKGLVSHLRKKIPRAILLLLSQFPETQELCITDLSKILDLPPSTLHWHTTKLIQDQLIASRRRGREVVLELLIEKSVVQQLGEKIYPTRWEKFLDDIDRTFSSLFSPK